MNDIKARQKEKEEGSELSKRLHNQRPMFERMLSELHLEQAYRMLGDRFYQ